MQITKQAKSYRIASVNWPEAFPYRPEVGFTIWHDGSSLHIRYEVEEQAVLAKCDADRQHVWEDSCVEFFFAPDGSGEYYNIECTCTGKLYMCIGRDRHERAFLPQECYDMIRRRPSLGDKAFGLIDSQTSWEVELEIPAGVFGLESYNGLKAKGNFYKCGDGLKLRHYLSWAPIHTEKPDFHRPEYFAELEFE